MFGVVPRPARWHSRTAPLEDDPVTRLPHISRRDPYWDVDGASVRRTRLQRRFVRYLAWILILSVFVLVGANLPALDADYLFQGGGRPLLAGALLMLLGSAAILALARIHRVSHS